jgi:hypothetical protein
MYGTIDFGGRGMSRAGVRNCTERVGLDAQMPPFAAVVDHAIVGALNGATTLPAVFRTVFDCETRKARAGLGAIFICTWKFWTPKRPVLSSYWSEKMKGGRRSFSVEATTT